VIPSYVVPCESEQEGIKGIKGIKGWDMNTAAAAVFSGILLWVEAASTGRKFRVGVPLITK
jgi:hypothetical protein